MRMYHRLSQIKQQYNALSCNGKTVEKQAYNGMNHFIIQPRCACIILSAPEVLIQENTAHLQRHMVFLILKSSPRLIISATRPRHTASESSPNKTDSGDLSEVEVLRNMMNSDNIMEPPTLDGSLTTSQVIHHLLKPILP